MKKMNNKGFSLVELIVVIAIMAVLVGVLAPQFIKYVESSRRSTDVSNAQNIQSAVLADIANTASGFTGTGDITRMCTGSGIPTSLGEAPKVKGNKVDTATGKEAFEYTFNAAKGTCTVKVGGYDLTSDDTTSGVPAYKKAD